MLHKLDPENRFANDFTRMVDLTPPVATTPTHSDDCAVASDETAEAEAAGQTQRAPLSP